MLDFGFRYVAYSKVNMNFSTLNDTCTHLFGY